MKDEARNELMLDDVSLDNPSDFEIAGKKIKKLQKQTDILHKYFKKKLNKFDYKRLNELINLEIELESYCNI